jgi:hypothetical protein
METKEQNTYNNHNNHDLQPTWNAMQAGIKHLSPFIDGIESVCCGAFVASSIMCAAAFAAFSEWF